MFDMTRETQFFSSLASDAMMSPEGMKSYLQKAGSPRLLALCEPRDTPLHSVTELPLRWESRPNGDGLSGHAQPGEHYAFQVGVFAHGAALENVRCGWTALRGGGEIPAHHITCYNLSGTDTFGKPLRPVVSIGADRLRPLWFGVSIPEDASGMYQGQVSVWADGVEAVTLPYSIEVSGAPRPDHGDDEPWRHSRLRWLDSKIAQDDEITAPYSPIEKQGDTVSILGRSIRLSPSGLPGGIDSYFAKTNETLTRKATPVLAGPIVFTVETDGGELSLAGQYTVREHKPGVLRIVSETTDGNLTLSLSGSLEYDGYAEYGVTVSCRVPTRVRDIRLTIPHTEAASRYLMGMGRLGGLRREDIDWKWDKTLNQDTLWVGGVNAGLMLRLKDETYEKPYMLIYYHYKPLNVPACWDNGGLGGCRVEGGERGAVVTAYSGERTLSPESPLTFLFDLTATPLKPINKPEHWNDHYYHAPPEDLKKVSKSGANIINLHHANRYNPYINYPFFETDRLASFVDECHQNSLRVKLYYTIKELTVRTPEFWAFQSLGEEIFPSTYEIGESFQGAVPYADDWLRAYVKEKYITAWRQRVTDGPYVDEMEASLMVAPMSRLNNYFLEGLKWILNQTYMDGLYFDDVAFDRTMMKRIRKVLDRHHPLCTIDLHSWNYFKNNTVDDSRLAGYGNSMNLYIDNFAFIDRIWFGEGFDYDEAPDVWLVEMSGIPFGMMGEMLQDGGNAYRGMVYGMTCRLPNENDPRGVWQLWKDFGMQNATMLGYWNEDCPVSAGNDQVRVTVYRKPEKVLLAIGSWSGETETVSLKIDFDALGLQRERCALSAPAVPGFQEGFALSLDEPLTIPPGQGCLLLLTETKGGTSA